MTTEPVHHIVDQAEALLITGQIVAAYVGNNPVSQNDLQNLIMSTHATLVAIGGPKPEPVEELKPAVPVRQSIKPDFLICLEDGKKFKSLKRHLKQHFNLTPDEYREKWGLPDDYPMVAPNYSEKRSQLAKAHGLGRK